VDGGVQEADVTPAFKDATVPDRSKNVYVIVCLNEDDAAVMLNVLDCPISTVGTVIVEALGIVVSVSEPFSPEGTFTVPGRYVCDVGEDIVA
jgi:hypothetical protein